MNIEKVASALEWVYTATVTLTAGHEASVRVTAFDLAGNEIEVSGTVD